MGPTWPSSWSVRLKKTELRIISALNGFVFPQERVLNVRDVELLLRGEGSRLVDGRRQQLEVLRRTSDPTSGNHPHPLHGRNPHRLGLHLLTGLEWG